MLKLLCSAAAAFLGSAPSAAASRALAGASFPSAAASRALAGASFLGFNVVNLQSGNFTTDEAYAAATAGALQAGVLRYPGGNIADFWDWRVGWCVAAPNASGCPSCRNPCPSKLRRRTYLLEEFAVALRAAAALPVYTLNMLTANLTESLAMLAHAESIGALPRGAYVELGGEFYWGKFEGRWATGAAFAAEANAWAAAVRARFPGARAMAVASHSVAMKDPADRGFLWNEQLYAALDPAAVAGVTLHPYLHLGDAVTGEGPLQPGVGPRAKGEGPTGWSANATVQQLNVDLLRSNAGAEALLGVPFFVASSAAGNAATHTPLPPGLRMIVTEYNVMERAGPLKLTWLHALFTAATAFNLLAVPAVDAVLLHVLLNGFGWGALYETDADFKGPFGGTPPPGSAATAVGKSGCEVGACAALVTEPYAPTAVGTALGALSLAMRGATAATPLDLASGTARNPNRVGANPAGLPGNVTYPSLLGWRFDGGAAPTSNATVLNLSPAALPYAPPPCTAATTWTTPDAAGGSPVAWATTSAPVQRRMTACSASGATTLTLPPYSITTVTLLHPSASVQ
jgi:hypothetical protein